MVCFVFLQMVDSGLLLPNESITLYDVIQLENHPPSKTLNIGLTPKGIPPTHSPTHPSIHPLALSSHSFLFHLSCCWPPYCLMCSHASTPLDLPADVKFALADANNLTANYRTGMLNYQKGAKPQLKTKKMRWFILEE